MYYFTFELPHLQGEFDLQQGEFEMQNLHGEQCSLTFVEKTFAPLLLTVRFDRRFRSTRATVQRTRKIRICLKTGTLVPCSISRFQPPSFRMKLRAAAF